MTFREMHDQKHISYALVTIGVNAGKIRFDFRDAVGKRFLSEAGKNIAAYKEEIEFIREELKAEKAAEEARVQERRAKIDAIEGLKDLERCKEAWDSYHRAFDRMMSDQDNDGARPPKCPAQTVEELSAKYPRASAYLTAQSLSGASHYAKSAAGRKALERIINGEDHEQVIADMKAEWSAYCDDPAWY